MCASMADIQSATAEIRRGKKERRRRTNDRMKIQRSALFHRATINSEAKKIEKGDYHQLTITVVNMLKTTIFFYHKQQVGK